MSTPASPEERLAGFDAEVQSAWEDAQARLGEIRRVKLGDMNLRDDLYADMIPIFRSICANRGLRRVYFSGSSGRRLRRLLLVFMSELVYWDYRHSFWRKLFQVLNLEHTQSEYHWFTQQMVVGYRENDIPLIVTRGWLVRSEYVRTIIRESGFSRQLVEEAKRFVLWYFDHHSDLDPRSLDTDSFSAILDQYGVWNKKEMFDLLRDMVGAVARLLREIRRLSLTSADLKDPQVISELQEALGFHPIRGIFGFRSEQDIEELLDKISRRMTPRAFRVMLDRKGKTNRGGFQVITPEGQTIVATRAKDVPVCYGHYQVSIVSLLSIDGR